MDVDILSVTLATRAIYIISSFDHQSGNQWCVRFAFVFRRTMKMHAVVVRTRRTSSCFTPIAEQPAVHTHVAQGWRRGRNVTATNSTA